MHTHMVYFANYKDKIIYIGSGILGNTTNKTSDRCNHVISGVSHVYGLNKIHFEDKDNIKVEIVKGFNSQEEALQCENMLIEKFNPSLNRRNCKPNLSKDYNSQCMEEYKGEYIRCKKVTRSSYDKFEALERGYKPSVRTAIEYYENESKDNEMLFKVMPEFKEWIDSGISISVMRSLKESRDKINDKMNQLRLIDNNEYKIKEHMGLEVGKIYTTQQLIERLTYAYDKMNVCGERVKATHVKKWYNLKSSSILVNSIKVNGYKIISEL